MLDLKNKRVSLIGYGLSNKSLCDFLLKGGANVTVHCPEKCSLPAGVDGVFGEGYLKELGDIVFRSPGVRPDKIDKISHTEAELALNMTDACKIGITGSDGKTTTCTLAYLMLSRGGKGAFLGGNIGKPLIGISPLLRKGDFLVAELSSFQLFGASLRLDVGAITGITQNHLDWHRDMEEYAHAKASILKKAKRQVLNYDDPLVRSLGKRGCVYFSLRDCTELIDTGCDFVHIVNGQILYNRHSLFPLSSVALKGDFNVQNVLCAIGCVYPFVDKDAMHDVAREFCGVENRMESVLTLGGVEFICSAIDSTPSRTLKTLSAFDPKNVIAILGGYDKNLDYECLRKTLNRVKAIVLCGENRGKIERCVDRHVINVNTLKEATEVAYGLSCPGDFVILTPASASFDMFKNYKEKAICFKNAVRGLKNGKN